MRVRARSERYSGPLVAVCGWRPAPPTPTRRPRCRTSLPRAHRLRRGGGFRLQHQLTIEVEEFQVETGSDLGLPQLTAPEDVAHPAPSRFQQIGHGSGRRRAVLVAVGHQSTGQPIGAHRRLAGTHTGPRTAANVFEGADRGILEPGRHVLRPDQLALAGLTPSAISDPSSIMCRTSSHSMGSTSGCGTLTAVVPRMATLNAGTMMSPSPGL